MTTKIIKKCLFDVDSKTLNEPCSLLECLTHQVNDRYLFHWLIVA